MTKATIINFLDSSAWLLYFFDESEEVARVIEGGGILISSAVSLFEIKRKLIKSNFEMEKINEVLGHIKLRSMILSINSIICEKAAEISVKHNLAAVDSLIYCTSLLNNAEMLTADNDFRGLENIRIVA